MSEGKEIYVQKVCKFSFHQKQKEESPSKLLSKLMWGIFFHTHSPQHWYTLRAFKADTIPNNM